MRTSPFLLMLALAGCFEDTSSIKSAFLPPDYQTQFLLARACQADTGNAHGQGYQIIRANNLGMQGPPYAPGSVFVSELHGDPGCTSLQSIYAIAKEEPGYDPGNGDWHWQRLSSIQRVLDDGKLATCATCHAACAPSDRVCSRR
jgi:hypothetical protein